MAYVCPCTHPSAIDLVSTITAQGLQEAEFWDEQVKSGYGLDVHSGAKGTKLYQLHSGYTR